MADDKKTDKIGKSSKVGEVKETEEVRKSEAITRAGAVQKASGVGKVVRSELDSSRYTRQFSSEDREELMRLVGEEADKLFGKSGISEEKKKIIADAVKMAIDSGLLEDADEKSN